MNKKFVIPIVVVLAILFFPVKIDCGAPGASCVTAPVRNDALFPTYYFSYDIEPLGVMLLEVVTRTDLPIRYYNKTEKREILPEP